jgi:hypothetical protein
MATFYLYRGIEVRKELGAWSVYDLRHCSNHYGRLISTHGTRLKALKSIGAL